MNPLERLRHLRQAAPTPRPRPQTSDRFAQLLAAARDNPLGRTDVDRVAAFAVGLHEVGEHGVCQQRDVPVDVMEDVGLGEVVHGGLGADGDG